MDSMTCIAIRTFIPQAIERARAMCRRDAATPRCSRRARASPFLTHRRAMRAASSSSSARIVRDHRFRRLRRVDARRIASARATDGDDERASTSFSIVPADAEDGLRRYRAVLAPLPRRWVPPRSRSLRRRSDLRRLRRVVAGRAVPGARALTALWAVGGPAAAAGLATGSVVGDVGVTCVASAEIIVGLDFPSAIAPAEIPGPIVAAQTVNLASLVGLRAWQTDRVETAARPRSRAGRGWDSCVVYARV